MHHTINTCRVSGSGYELRCHEMKNLSITNTHKYHRSGEQCKIDNEDRGKKWSKWLSIKPLGSCASQRHARWARKGRLEEFVYAT